jgi:hypothetical protein
MQENPFKSNNNVDDDSQSHIFGNLSSSTIESTKSYNNNNNNNNNGPNKYSNIPSQSSVIELAANILYNDATK